MEIRHLRTFVCAAESQGFTRAAVLLGLTQAAVSQHVAAMEKELGTALFDRGSRSVALTDAGRKVYDRATQILSLVEEIQQLTGEKSPAVRGIIKIACSTVPSEWLLPELLLRFRKLHPEVRESVSVSDSEAAIAAVESGACDLGLVGELPRASKLCAQAIAQDELMLVAAPDHEFARQKRIKPDDLREQPLIVREPGSGSRWCVEQALSLVGLTTNDLAYSMEVNSNDAIRAALERGIGISFLSTRAIAREVQDKRLVPIEVEGVQAVRSLYLITDPDRLPTRAVRAFLNLADDWRGRSEKRVTP